MREEDWGFPGVAECPCPTCRGQDNMPSKPFGKQPDELDNTK